MTKHRVVVKGGGKNLYYVKESGGWYQVSHRRVSLLGDRDIDLGKARSMHDALAMIESHSGKKIARVE